VGRDLRNSDEEEYAAYFFPSPPMSFGMSMSSWKASLRSSRAPRQEAEAGPAARAAGGR